jgi:hypothetical protein
MRRLIHIMVALVLMVAISWSQPGIGVSIEQMYDDNVDNNAFKTSDHITAASLQGAYDVGGETTSGRLFYTGTMSYFGKAPARTFFYHSLNLEFSHSFDDDEAAVFYSGLSLNRRVDGDVYTIYDHDQWSWYVNGKLILADWWLGKFGYTIRRFAFKEIGDLNYSEHRGFVQSAFSLLAGTTIIVEADLGAKSYSNPAIPVDDGDVRTGNGTSDGVVQTTGILRVGQAIADGFGISLTGQYVFSLSNSNRFFISGDDLISAEEIFDDQYSYRGPQAVVTLTRIFDGGVMAVLTAGWQNKLFPGRPVLDLDGNVLGGERSDARWHTSIEIESETGLAGMTLTAGYEYITNSSNDRLYEYVNNVLSLGLQYAY